MTETIREGDAQLLQRLGDNAAKWAAEFRKTAIGLGYSDMDGAWLICWFANAIEHSTIVRRSAALSAQSGDPVAEKMAHKTMTRAEYDSLNIEGWHGVCHNYDGFDGTGIRYASPPVEATGDTGHNEADRVIDRLMSSDPQFDDCQDAALLIRKLVVEHKGPDGYATWKDAAIAARLTAASPPPEPDALWAYLGRTCRTLNLPNGAIRFVVARTDIDAALAAMGGEKRS